MSRRPRLVPFIASLVLLWSLGLSLRPAHARVEQFCGYVEQFADFIIIHATIEPASRLVIPSQWVQLVPHVYLLLGSGTIVRDPLLTVAQEFVGGLVIVNPSPTSFLGNPACTVSTELTIVDERLPLITGPAVVTCFGGPSGIFQGTLQLRLTSCNPEPPFPVEAAALAQTPAERIAVSTAALAQAASDRIGTTRWDAPKIPMGEAPNEYVGR